MVSQYTALAPSMSDETVGPPSLTNAEYHGLTQVIGKSHLDEVAKSPAHYWAKFLDPNRVKQEPTPAMLLGTAVHTAILEPHLWDQQYAVAPQIRRGTKAWAEFEQQAEGKTLLKQEDADLVRRMADAVHKHPASSFLLTLPGQVEQTIRWTDEDTGLDCKCRPDWLSQDSQLVVDVKTTEDASPRGFAMSCAKFRYHVQAHWYQRPFPEAEQFLFIAVEKQPPYLVAVYAATPEMVSAGQRRADEDLRLISACKASGEWPGYSTEIQPLYLPAWCHD
jgi:hypothetical protein